MLEEGPHVGGCHPVAPRGSAPRSRRRPRRRGPPVRDGSQQLALCGGPSHRAPPDEDPGRCSGSGPGGQATKVTSVDEPVPCDVAIAEHRTTQRDHETAVHPVPALAARPSKRCAAEPARPSGHGPPAPPDRPRRTPRSAAKGTPVRGPTEAARAGLLRWLEASREPTIGPRREV